LTFKGIRENDGDIIRNNKVCTRPVVHVYSGFKWYNYTRIVPGVAPSGRSRSNYRVGRWDAVTETLYLQFVLKGLQ